MKYVSLLVLVLLLAASWKLSSSVDPVSVKTHYEIQTDLTKIIEAAVLAQMPQAKDFKFIKIYTETLNPSTVQASFGYTFTDPTAEGNEQTLREVDGTALLTRDSADLKKWVLENIKVDQSAIEFQDGLTISVDGTQPL
jgi:hypothetical protein